MGTLEINSLTAEVLYDSGASHSFLSEVFAQRHNIPFQSMPTPFVVKTPGSRWQTRWVAPEVNVTVGTLSFPFSMISLKTDGIDAIMGMDWLSKYKAKLDCAARTIQLTQTDGNSILSYCVGSSAILPQSPEILLYFMEGVEDLPPREMHEVDEIGRAHV